MAKKQAQDMSKQKKNKAVTSYDVAKLAGVSQSAVSRVFSQKGYVSETVKAKVEEAATELGFRPNRLARSLITGKSKLIAVIVADLYYSFYVSILHQLNAHIRSAGYQVMLFSIPSSEDLDSVSADVLDYQVDGVILTSARLSTKVVDSFKAANIPVVTMVRTVDDPEISSVTADNYAAGKTVASFLIEGRHNRYAFIGGVKETSTSRDREAGFIETINQDVLVRYGNFSYDGGYQAALDLMQDKTPPDAFFCASDIMAMGAMDALRFDLELRAVDDFSIVGFNNAAETAWRTYDLTTINSSPALMCERAIKVLTKQIEKPNPDEVVHERLAAELVIRGSARIPDSYLPNLSQPNKTIEEVKL